MIKNYENLFILEPSLSEEALKGEIEAITKIIGKYKGKVEATDVWGKRMLAYPIKDKDEGFYVLFEVKFPPENIDNLKKELELNQRILRYFILKK
ncbi:30S ribosomal protein S6 [subsurface metagenome]